MTLLVKVLKLCYCSSFKNGRRKNKPDSSWSQKRLLAPI